MLKDILFPFSNRHGLDDYTWHRAFQVLFSALIFITFCTFQYLSAKPYYDAKDACYSIANTPPVVDSSRCATLPQPPYLSNFLWATLVTLIISYVLQVIYYKVFVYIIKGNKSF